MCGVFLRDRTVSYSFSSHICLYVDDGRWGLSPRESDVGGHAGWLSLQVHLTACSLDPLCPVPLTMPCQFMQLVNDTKAESHLDPLVFT